MTTTRPRIALLGGNGGRSGVPRHINQLCDLLGTHMDITVVSDVNEGGFDFATAPHLTHRVVPGMSSSLNPRRLARTWAAFRTTLAADGPFDIIWAHARLSLPFSRKYLRTVDQTAHLITTYHGSPFLGRAAAISAIMRQIEKRHLATTPRHDLVFLSGTDRDSFAGLPLDRHRVHVIPNCSDLGTLASPTPPDHPTLIMTTRAARQKNLIAAARIFAALPADYRLILRGMGTDTKAKHLFATTIGADPCRRITFGGPVDDVRADLAAADGYLLTSRYEGLSIGALEAFEAGLPVAMPDIGGADVIARVHPQFCTINTSDPRACADSLKAIISDFRTDRTRHIAANHAGWASAFHPDKWSKRITRLLMSSGVALGNLEPTGQMHVLRDIHNPE